MLRLIIEREVARQKRNGFDSIVTTESIDVFGKEKTFSLGSDVAIITGVTFDDDMQTFDDLRLSISSATDCVSGSMKSVASSGTSIYKVMRQYLSVRKDSDTASPLTVHFVKITPKKIK
jgi:hypothetical protein